MGAIERDGQTADASKAVQMETVPAAIFASLFVLPPKGEACSDNQKMGCIFTQKN